MQVPVPGTFVTHKDRQFEFRFPMFSKFSMFSMGWFVFVGFPLAVCWSNRKSSSSHFEPPQTNFQPTTKSSIQGRTVPRFPSDGYKQIICSPRRYIHREQHRRGKAGSTSFAQFWPGDKSSGKLHSTVIHRVTWQRKISSIHTLQQVSDPQLPLTKDSTEWISTAPSLWRQAATTSTIPVSNPRPALASSKNLPLHPGPRMTITTAASRTALRSPSLKRHWTKPIETNDWHTKSYHSRCERWRESIWRISRANPWRYERVNFAERHRSLFSSGTHIETTAMKKPSPSLRSLRGGRKHHALRQHWRHKSGNRVPLVLLLFDTSMQKNGEACALSIDLSWDCRHGKDRENLIMAQAPLFLCSNNCTTTALFQ